MFQCILTQHKNDLTPCRSGRRAANNRIRGPQSALTDFLASNNISAAQISADYERRQREAQQREQEEAAANPETIEQDNEEDEESIKRERAEQKRGRKIVEVAASNRISGIQRRKEEKIEQKKQQKREQKEQQKKHQKKQQKKRKRDDSDGDDDDDAVWDMYTKKKPLPGQLENCESCDKRFTVTPYSKTGPEGGLLCTKCSKEQTDHEKKSKKPKKQAVSRDKRRQVQSNLLDGIVQIGARSLQDICIKVRI